MAHVVRRCLSRGTVGLGGILLALLVMSCAPNVVGPDSVEGQDQVSISFLSFTAGNPTHLAAGALAEAVRLNHPDWTVGSMAAGGEALLTARRIAGDADFFFARSSRALELEWQVPLHPDIDFADATRYNLVMPVSSSFIHVLVKRDTGLDSLSDLVERRYPYHFGSGAGVTRLLYSKILEYYGASEEEAEAWGVHHETVVIPSAEGVEAMKAGRVDVGLTFSPIPNAYFMAMGLDVKLLPVDDAGLVSLLEDLGCVPVVIPAGTYPFLNDDVATMAGPYPLVVRPDMPDEVVYEVVKAALEHSDLLFAVSAEARSQMQPDAIAAAVTRSRTVGEPYHPGALKYYREQGWID